MTDSDPSLIRLEDYSLSDEQMALRDTVRDFCTKHCPPSRARDAEPTGFDPELWRELCKFHVARIGVPECAGGDDGGLVELALVAGELGRSLASIPFVETVTAARLLSETEAGMPWLAEILESETIVSVGLHGAKHGDRQLVPAAGVATLIVTLVDGQLTVDRSGGRSVPHNLGSIPVAWWSMGGPEGTGIVLASGDEANDRHARAVRCWKILTSALLVGMAEAALDLGVAYATERRAFGVPIGSFQAIAHPLADVAIALQAAQRLVWRAAWFADHEPDAAMELVPATFFHATAVSQQASTTAIHVLGGLGFTLESEAQQYFRRSKALAVLSGDPRDELRALADLRFGPTTSH